MEPITGPAVWHDAGMLAPVDETFFDSAPLRFQETFEIDQPAAAVWQELTRDNTLDWCRGLRITWTSPRPYGVGTTRQAKLFGGLLVTVREEYFIWEEGHRMAFYVTSAVPPTYRRSAEDYLVEPVSESHCTFTWTLAFELSPLGKLGGPVTKQIVANMFTSTRRHFEVPISV